MRPCRSSRRSGRRAGGGGEHRRRLPDRRRSPSRVRGLVTERQAAHQRTEDRHDPPLDRDRGLPPRQPDPLAASRSVGGFDVVAARDPGSDCVRDAESQIANLFHHVDAILRTAGADWRHVVRMNFYVPDLAARSDQQALAGALPRRRRSSRPAHPGGRPTGRVLRLPRLRGRLMMTLTSFRQLLA